MRETGERVIIDGHAFPPARSCSTSCREPICVTPRAVLGFHAARLIDLRSGEEYSAAEATRVVAEAYPAAIRAWIRRRGGLTARPIFLHGRELAKLYPACR